MLSARKFITGLILFAPMAVAADSSLVDLIMPDARVVFGVDIAKIRNSPLLPAFTSGVENANPEMQKLMQAAGFDPFRDLQDVIFASPGTGKHPPALLVARGSFDATRLRAFAEAAGSKITEWKGVPILTDPDKESGAFALLDHIILAGNLDQIKAAIGRRGQGMVLNTEMAMRIADLSHRYDAWLVSIAPLATMAANFPSDSKIDGLPNMEMLRSIDQFSLGVSMSSDLTLAADIVADNGQSAGAIGDAMQMLLAMAQQGAKDQPAAMAALHNLKLEVEQNVVHLALTVPIEDVQTAMRDAVKMQMSKPAPMLATRQPVPEPVILQSTPRSEAPPQVAVATSPEAAPAPPSPRPAPVKVLAKSPRIPPNAQIMIQSSPKDMGTVVIMGQK